MSIIQSVDLEARGLLHDQSSSLAIQGKWFKPGPSFRKSLRQVAIEFCADARTQRRQYILIEFPTYFMAWRRFIPKKATPSYNASTQVPSPSPRHLSPASARPSAQGTQSKPSPRSERLDTHKSSPTFIDDEFIHQCKVELTYYIGPIAENIVEQVLDQAELDNPEKLIEALANHIQDFQASHSFALKLAEVIFSQ